MRDASGESLRAVLACATMAVLLLAAGCTTEAPKPEESGGGGGESPETAGEGEGGEAEAPAGPVREEVAVSLTGFGRVRYTLALNKTTGVTMEQTHATPTRTVVFPAGKTSVARFELSDGRAIEMAVQRPHRLDDGPVRFDGCVLRMNWSLGGEGRVTAPCGEFVGREGPRTLQVHESLDESVALVVEQAMASDSERVAQRPGGDSAVAESLDDSAFATSSWHSDGGEWVFLPSGLSVESVVRRRE